MIPVDIWLRGQDFATTRSIESVHREPSTWTDDDVRTILQEMLQTMHRMKHPADSDAVVALRGLSWIVNPFEDGGVVIAIEIGMGAAVAGPIQIDQKRLETMITRVLATPSPSPSSTVH